MTKKDILIIKDVLIADDEEIITTMLSTFLRSLDLSVETANNIVVLNHKLKYNKFKVICLDINFKTDYDGVQMCVDIRKTDKECKIYAMTGLTGLFNDIDCKVAGFNGVFYKPFNNTDFVTTILKDVNYLKNTD